MFRERAVVTAKREASRVRFAEALRRDDELRRADVLARDDALSRGAPPPPPHADLWPVLDIVERDRLADVQGRVDALRRANTLVRYNELLRADAEDKAEALARDEPPPRPRVEPHRVVAISPRPQSAVAHAGPVPMAAGSGFVFPEGFAGTGKRRKFGPEVAANRKYERKLRDEKWARYQEIQEAEREAARKKKFDARKALLNVDDGWGRQG